VDHQRIDAIIRSLSHMPSRRALVRGLLGTTLGVGSAKLPAPGEAKKKPKRKKKATCDDFVCRRVGQSCISVSQCCSGICEGESGQRTCQAHGTGTCDQDAPGVCAGSAETCNGRDACACFRTVAGSIFCAETNVIGDDCADCVTDADCEALGYVAGSACVPYTEGACAGTCPGKRTCKSPCAKVVPLPVNP
jgi:hypothetical protein